ncbi:TPA: hypothetical protein G8O14_005187, partial [Salmonella enterica]|nr:hypothetical protein [Salmonella enterica]
MAVKIDRKLNFVSTITRDDGSLVYLHIVPFPYEVVEENCVLLGNLFNTQYNDDPDIVAFFDAYNKLAQEYLDYFNNLNLPCWTSPAITGELLDWIAAG